MKSATKYEDRKALKRLCILLAFLLCLTSAASGEDLTGPAATEGDGPFVSETPAGDVPTDTEHAPEMSPQESPSNSEAQPTEEAPAEEPGSVPEEQPSPDIEAQPTGEAPAEEPGGDPEEQPSPDGEAELVEDATTEEPGGESLEPVGEETPDESDEEPEDDVQWNGVLRVGSVCEIFLSESRLYRLTSDKRAMLTLEVDGIAVKITVTSLESGLTRFWQSEATEDPHNFTIRESLTLEKGEYSVAVEPLRGDEKGLVSLCFCVPVTETPEIGEQPEEAPEETPDGRPVAEDELREDEPEEVPSPAETEAAVQDDLVTPEESPVDEDDDTVTTEETATDEDDTAVPEETPADGDDTAAPEEIMTDEGNDASSEEEPDNEEPAESAAIPLTVRLLVSCEEEYRLGARVTLTAVVSDPDYQGIIRWQYSADGGKTVCDVEGAEGTEFSFVLDEVNSAYWWRVCLE